MRRAMVAVRCWRVDGAIFSGAKTVSGSLNETKDVRRHVQNAERKDKTDVRASLNASYVWP